MNKLKLLLVSASIAFAGAAQAQELPYSLKQMLTSEAYTGTLKAMVNPQTLQNPVAMCASCHDGKEMARYQQTLGPMMAMMNPVNWINPMAYINMMAPVMDPKSYEMWYNDYVEKYGKSLGLMGDEAKEATE